MKKIPLLCTLAAFLCVALAADAQQSDISLGPATLTAACTNANTTCDTANPPNFGPNGTIVGPATLEGSTQGYGIVQITLNGVSTAVGSTLNFEFSDDGGTSWYSNTCTRSDIPVQEPSEAIPATTYRAWDCAVGAATRFRVRQSAISSGQAVVRATLTAGLLEPAPTVQLAGLKYAAITTATNTLVQATPVFVHTIVISNPGATTNSITVVDTTAGACTGGTTIMTIPSAQLASTNAPITITLDVQTTNGLCITTAGTTSPQLVVTYR